MQDIKSAYRSHYTKGMTYPKKEIKKTTPFLISLQRIKYLGINLAKGVKDLYIEKYKKWMRKIKDDTDNMERHPMFMNWRIYYH